MLHIALIACYYCFDMSFGPEDAEAVYKLSQSNTHLGRRVLSALRIIEEALDRYGYAEAGRSKSAKRI